MTMKCRITATGTIQFLALLAICVLSPSLVEAQNFERYRPKLPSNLEGESKLPDKPAEATGDPKILVEELKGVIFVDHQDKVVKGAVDASGVQVRSDGGLQMLQTLCFQSVVEPYLGEPISLLRLNELVRDVIVFYRTNDQPVVDVSIPEQDVTDGVVQIVVTEGRIGEVRIDGACYFDPCYLVDQTCAIHHSQIFESVLLRDLRWLNRNPFREVDLELTPGKKQGETDIVFHVHDRRPL
ncbi:MAG: ShlB/FhaC/HecB family hemolysin secretion/activation protein, partial [Planctomycetaceae bacterium]|nr:ShlB/FhaC/HecB family hemolysin secretion/activation protein [Planctomycetaceae bacterium]